jgi:tetratricopeptide (TPR) repeat protein
MKATHPRSVASSKATAKRLLKLERSGRYETALETFSEAWAEAGFVPDISDLQKDDGAELLLRFGSLIGFHSFKHQIDGGQARSKDLITAARTHFVEIGSAEKIAECENYIALAYWRGYEYPEALTWVETALSHPLSVSSPTRLHSLMITSMILHDAKRYVENVEHSLSVEQEMRDHGDAFLNGSLCSNLALSFKNLGESAHAMKYLTLARHFHERSGHKPYLGTIQNNLAQLHKEERRFKLAHESADSAIKIYRLIKDRAREASTLDTKAQIYIAERRFAEAEKVATESIAMLGGLKNSAMMTESLMTRATARLRAENLSEALDDLIEAVNITKQQNGETSARSLIDSFAEELRKAAVIEMPESTVETGDMELVLPPSLAHYPDYKGIWINTGHLERFGIAQGSLAVVTPIEVCRGDLVAVSENESGAVSCGTYDFEFGIVCLDRGDDEPLLFDENEIQILGKIIGYCIDTGGEMKVQALV